jgi:hypothetical protein
MLIDKYFVKQLSQSWKFERIIIIDNNIKVKSAGL